MKEQGNIPDHVLWEHRDSSGASFRMTNSSGQALPHGGGWSEYSTLAEYDPAGADASMPAVTTVPEPQEQGNGGSLLGYPGAGIPSFFRTTYTFNGIPVCDERTPECRDFINLPRPQRQEQFRTQPIEKQVDMYLCAVKAEPPDLSLADEFTNQGENAIPVLLQRLKTAEKEIDQEYIIYAFQIMSERGDLRGRKDIIADISQEIDNMRIDPVRQRSLERLKKIQINSGVKPFTYVN